MKPETVCRQSKQPPPELEGKSPVSSLFFISSVAVARGTAAQMSLAASNTAIDHPRARERGDEGEKRGRESVCVCERGSVSERGKGMGTACSLPKRCQEFLPVSASELDDTH